MGVPIYLKSLDMLICSIFSQCKASSLNESVNRGKGSDNKILCFLMSNFCSFV